MTNQEINKAIAEFCGWKYEFNGDHEDPEWYWIPPYNPDGNGNPPNYCNNLNAMHEAEKLLSAVNKNDYLYYLEDVCKTDCWTIMNSEERFRIVNAAAKQRAEAFLRTINKWKES